jgi:hypothetical protein
METKKETIYEKLAAIQHDLNAPKDLFNKFGNYKYRSAESILAALKPLLAKHGLVLLITDKVELVGDRTYILATVKLTDGTSDISVQAYAREEEAKKGMDASQVTGAASSYARKYALNGLFAIDDTKDADALNTTESFTEQVIPKDIIDLCDMLKGDISIAPDIEAVKAIWADNKNKLVKYKTIFNEVKQLIVAKGNSLNNGKAKTK